MQAIQTKVLPATNTKPARITAWCARGRNVWSIPCDMDSNSEETHRAFANRLRVGFAAADLQEYGTPEDENPWSRPFASGCLPDGTFAHVFKS